MVDEYVVFIDTHDGWYMYRVEHMLEDARQAYGDARRYGMNPKMAKWINLGEEENPWE